MAFGPSTSKIEPSRKAKTGGTPGISWYCTIRSSLVSPLCVEFGSWNVKKDLRKKVAFRIPCSNFSQKQFLIWNSDRNFQKLIGHQLFFWQDFLRNSDDILSVEKYRIFFLAKADDHRILTKFFKKIRKLRLFTLMAKICWWLTLTSSFLTFYYLPIWA